MIIIHSILHQFRVISLPWWIAVGVIAIVLVIFFHKPKQLVGDLLIVYVLVILASTVLARDVVGYSETNVPVSFDLIGTWIKRITGDPYDHSELLLNFCMLIPVGVLFPWATGKRFLPTVLVGLGLITVIEISQLVTRRGYFELSDIVDNTVGVMIGYGLWCIGSLIWRKIQCSRRNNQRSSR